MPDRIELAAAGNCLLARAATLLEESRFWCAEVKHLVRESQDLRRQSQELQAIKATRRIPFHSSGLGSGQKELPGGDCRRPSGTGPEKRGTY
jgi:hypothetical protein